MTKIPESPGKRARRSPSTHRLLVLAGALLALACGDDGPAEPMGPEPVASVSVRPDTATLAVGGSVRLEATARTADGRVLERGVAWSSSDTAVVTINPSGVAVARGGGVATLTAAVEGKTGRATLTVRVPIASVRMEPADSVELAPGATLRLQAVPLAADGTELLDREVAWSSGDPGVAGVDAEGLVVARAEGLAVITATSEGRSGRAWIAVREPIVLPVIASFSPAGAVAGSGPFTLTVRGGGFLPGARVLWNGASREAERVSDAELRARIDAQDVAAPGVVQVRVVNAAAGGAASDPLPFEVAPQTNPVASVSVRPALVVTYVGASSELTAVLRDAAGGVVDGRWVRWTSSAPDIASVDSTGVVTGLAVGEAVITATSEGRSATASVSFRTGSSYHLAFDRDAPAFLWLDLRTGVASPTLVHGATVRASDPSPSPTRSGFAYVITDGQGAQPHIAIQSWSGTSYRFLTGGDQPAWSPDGQRIVFRSTRSGRADLWVMHADGTTAPVNLTADLPAGTASERPAWSPSGDRIVFAAGGESGRRDLWIMNADGSGKRPLMGSLYADTEPTWWGNAIAFTRRTAAGESDIWRVGVDGAGPQRLTHTGRAQMPAWSPDGRLIAYVERDGSSGPGDLYAMRAGGGDVRPLSLRADGPDGGGLNPAWTLHW